MLGRYVVMVKGLVYALVWSGLVLVMGCTGTNGWLRNRSLDYQQSSPQPPLEIPKNMHPEAFSEEYAISAIGKPPVGR